MIPCNRLLRLWSAEQNEMAASPSLFAVVSGEQTLNAVDLSRASQRKF
jgi:hypothetical protein